MRVVSWNVHGLRTGIRLVVETVLASEADFVCLQDLPEGREGRRALRTIAKESGYRIAGGGPSAAANLAILSKQRSGHAVMPLIRLPDDDDGASRRKRRMTAPEPLAILGLITGPPQRGSRRTRAGKVTKRKPTRGPSPVAILTTRFSADPSRRLRHASWIIDYLQQTNLPAVLACTTPEAPGGITMATLSRFVADPLGVSPEPATHPAEAPTQRLDLVLATPDIPSMTVQAIASVGGRELSEVSDHLPVLAQFEVPEIG